MMSSNVWRWIAGRRCFIGGIIMERKDVCRRVGLFLAIGLWFFFFVALASFRYDDWPSHRAFPHDSVQNLCGPVGAALAYGCYVLIGQGIFLILFFAGLCLAIWVSKSKITDLWLRAVGLVLLTVAFAATVHAIHPGGGGFPEGNGGLLGIKTSYFLQAHFNKVGALILLAMSFTVGLVLAADDLVLRVPGVVGQAIDAARSLRGGREDAAGEPSAAEAKPGLFARLAARIQEWRHREPEPAEPATPPGTLVLPQPGASAKVVLPQLNRPAPVQAPVDEDEPLKPPVLLDVSKIGAKPAELEVSAPAQLDAPEVTPQRFALDYEHDEPLPTPAADAAHADAGDPPPAVSAEIPPVEEQAVAPAAPRNDIVVRMANQLKAINTAPPRPSIPAPQELGEYHLPGWNLLADAETGYNEAQEKFVREQARVLEQALREYGIDAQVVEIDTGPVITMYEIMMAAGTKVSQINALHNDIARSLAATSVRIVAPVPGKNTVGIEVPNAQKEKVRLKDLLQLTPEAQQQKMMIPVFLGKDASGVPLVADLAAMPHCLIAGTTGSGKSVCINTIILSIMYTQRPDMVKLILFDPKVVEMAPFKEIPHLMCPVINESGRATSVLDWACEKMDERYELLAEAGVKNVAGYNKLSADELFERFQPANDEERARIPKKLPYIVIIVDELADLMMTSGKEVEAFIVRLAQKARAVGIHLILATQRPQATVVTGLIKANMPCKIAFRVASRMDSRIVLDQNGADVLLGQGDMLYLPPGSSRPIRAQGTYIDDREIRDSVKLVSSMAAAQYEPELVQIRATIGDGGDMEKDELFDDAVRVVIETKRGSVSLLQRRLTIGYSRASRLIESMAAAGILGDYKGSQAREVMITLDQWEAMHAQQQSDEEDGMTV
jgi:S-DNA-T family DNA segregation ATPase FtsK/SpoIIIE